MIEKILAYILVCCNNSEFEQTTVALISENLKISRSQVSVVLNGSLTLAHSQNSQMSFMYGFFFVKFLFFTVVCVVIVI